MNEQWLLLRELQEVLGSNGFDKVDKHGKPIELRIPKEQYL